MKKEVVKDLFKILELEGDYESLVDSINLLKKELEVKNKIENICRARKSLDSLFVSEITDNRIYRSDKPELYEPCPKCGVKRPLLWDHIRRDYFDYNSHTDIAYIICEEVHEIAKRHYES